MPATSTDGYLLLVDKPAGLTSHDVVAIVRRALGTEKAGHAGTLDPFATGLLVILGGKGTRLIPYVPGEPKEYVATIRFGIETDTDDATGQVVRTSPPPSPSAVDAVLPVLTGEITQVPPAYSAKHVAGRRAYALARRGDSPVITPTAVRVHGWQVLERTDDELRVHISCGGGTYIRALARDLGRLSGSAAHLAELRRTSAGPFDVSAADTLDQVRAGAARPRRLRDALGAIAEQTVDDGDKRRVAHGMCVAATVSGDVVALTDEEGALLAVASRQGSDWHPDVVVAHA